MPIKVRFNKSILYDHVNWPIGSVCMMDDAKALYLIGTFVVEESDAPLSERPAPLSVRAKNDAQETGNAIASALKDAFTPKIEAVKAEAPKVAGVKG